MAERSQHPVEQLRNRIRAEGKLLWLSPDNLGIFESTWIDEVDATNFEDLVIPPKLSDFLSFKRSPPVRWATVRASVFEATGHLNKQAHLQYLYNCMEREAGKLSGPKTDQDLGAFATKVVARSLVELVVSDLPEQLRMLILRDQDNRLRRLFDQSGERRSLARIFAESCDEIRIGRGMQKHVRQKMPTGKPAEDYLQALLPLKDDIGAVRLSYVLTTLLTAVAGAPGPVAACLLYELFAHADWQEKIREELSGLSREELCQAPSRSAPLTRAFVLETLRLWSFPILARRPVKKPLRVGTEELCPGQSYILSTYLPHRDETHWSEPDTFSPERWSSPGHDRPKGAYVPFGWAKRSCLGASIGLSQMVLFCHLLLTRFEFDQVKLGDGIQMGNIAFPERFMGRVAKLPDLQARRMQSASPG